MKKRLSYATMLGRHNMIKAAILGFFVWTASYPRLILEVFLRKNMGERYFSLASAITVFCLLWILPLLPSPFQISYPRNNPDLWDAMKDQPDRVLFSLLFLYMSFRRYREVKREPSVFDFAKFSRYSGTPHDFFENLIIFGKTPSKRLIATVLEPGICFIIGLVLLIVHIEVGRLIMFCSICYSLSWYGSYHQGDHYVMDVIDQMIGNEEMVESFVEGRKPEETRGFETYMRPPNDPKMRRKVVDYMDSEEEEFEAF